MAFFKLAGNNQIWKFPFLVWAVLHFFPILKSMTIKKNIVDFTMGADPELLCFDGVEVIRGDTIVDEYEDSDYAKFGVDGNGINFEIRPSPNKNPLKLVSNIRNIFLSRPKLHKYCFLAGSCKHSLPLGGHIHFGIKGHQINSLTATLMLSQYLAPLGILIEDKKEAHERRYIHGYGHYNDFREQEHGFEYRTLSSWLTSPYIAASILCLAKTIMFEALNNPDFQPEEFVTELDINRSKFDSLLKKFPEIWKAITKMQLYQGYKPHIDLLYYLINNKRTWYLEGSVNAAWGLTDPTPYDSAKVGIDTLWGHLRSVYPTVNP
jgi:hypothetical protein